MADIVSLSKARKAKVRATQENQAVENRAKFGRTKAQKQLETTKKSLRDKLLDAHKRDD